jgi:hypothetical protein
MISFEVVTQTWQEMSQTPPHQASELVKQMSEEQPVALSFLLHLEDLPFNQYERELIFYVGLVVWQIIKRSGRQLYKVTRKKMGRAEEANVELLEQLAFSDEADYIETIQFILSECPEPEVLRYIVDAVMEEQDDPDEPGFREEYKGLAFLHLKILLDAFVSSLRPRPRAVA